jgi:hypothetical protein
VSKPLIYIAGPFRGKPNIEWLRQQNIRKAEALALEVWQNGGIAICPHKNTEHFDGCIPDDAFIVGDLEILRRCDAVLLLTDWRDSEGACREKDEANIKCIPVLHELDSYMGTKCWVQFIRNFSA